MTSDRLIINDIEIDLSPDTVIGLNSQINDLAELKDHQSSRSAIFKVPMTDNNIAALENSEQVQSGSVMPYRKNRARVIKGGVEVIQRGYAVIESSDNSYKITVYSGNLDFFNFINGKKMSDLDLSSMSHVFNFTNVTGSRTNTEVQGWKYPIVDYGNLLALTRTVNPKDLRLSLFTSYLFKKIITEAGFSFDGNIFSNAKFQKLLVSTNDDNSDNQFSNPDNHFNLLEEAYMFRFSLIPAPANPKYSGLRIFNTINDEYWNTTVEITYTVNTWAVLSSVLQLTYQAILFNHTDAEGVGTFTKTFTWLSGPYLAGYDGGFLYLEIQAFNLNFSVITGTIKHWNNEYNNIYVHVTPWLNIGISNDPVAGYAYIYLGTDLKTQYGYTTIDPAKELGDLTQANFFKSVSQIFGLMFKTDSNNNILYVRQFNEIVDAIPLAKDWSDKLNINLSQPQTFRLGNYAQTNNVKYSFDSTDNLLLEGYADGVILVDDETLKEENEAIKLPFAPSAMVQRLSGLVCPSIKRVDSEGAWSISTITRILYDDTRTLTDGDLTYNDNVTSLVTSNNIPLCYFKLNNKSFNLSFSDSLLLDNYSGITGVLNKIKNIIVLMKLSPIDFYQLDHFIPVYLKQFAAYFYINKVLNYTGNGLTKVNLIRIGQENLLLVDPCRNIFEAGYFASSIGWSISDPANWTFAAGELTVATSSFPILYNVFTQIEIGKCYKLRFGFRNGNSAKTITISINNNQYIFVDSIIAYQAGIITHEITINTLGVTNFMEVDVLDAGATSFVFTYIKIISCDCD